MSTDSPVSVEQFARVFVKGPQELPSDADSYYHPDRGYYFKLHLDRVSATEATPMIEKAHEQFDVELVRRVTRDGMFKERVYVDSADQVPDGYKVHTGNQGGIYYETGVQSVGVDEAGAESRNVAVIHWEDVELGDEIVYETPEGDEKFAEIIDIEEQDQEADVVHVDVDGEAQRAMPGTYSVENGEEKSSSSMVRLSKEGEWISYDGPRGGQGWQNIRSGEVIYQEEPPGETAEGSDDPHGPDFDPMEPPEGGYADGWDAPPEFAQEIEDGQSVEFFQDGSYYYGEVVDAEDGVSDGAHVVDVDGGDEQTVRHRDLTAAEASDPSDSNAPNPEEDIERFYEDDVAGDFIDTVNTTPGEGFTFKRNLEVDNPFERDVWFVGITSENLEAGEMDKEGIVDFYNEWMDILEDEPSLHIGGYAFEDGEKVSIDLSVAVEDPEEAQQLGEQFNQESIANLYVAEREGWDEGLIFTGGEGESPVEGSDDVREALSGIDSLAKRLMLGKSKVFDHEKVYDVEGRRLTGSQIAYMAMHGEIDPSAVNMTPVEEKGDSGTHSARYSPDGSDDYDHEDAQIDVEKGGSEVWTYYYGPDGGEGWLNMATGEIRYQQQRPGEPPEEGDGYGDWLGDGWGEAPESFEELQVNQDVEVFHDGEYEQLTVAGFHDDGEPYFDSAIEGDDWEITAAEADFDRHDVYFEDKDESPEDYWDAIVDYIPDNAPDEFEDLQVGDELALDIPTVDDPVVMPIYGYMPENDIDWVGENDIVFHYDDLEASVGEEQMQSNWGEPGEASPTISLTPDAVDSFVMGHADEVDVEPSDDLEDEAQQLVDEIEEETQPEGMIEGGPLDGTIDFYYDEEWDGDEFTAVSDKDFHSHPDSTAIVADNDGNYTVAQIGPHGDTVDTGEDSLFPDQVELMGVHEDDLTSQEDADADAEESEASGPSEDETSSAVAQPASEESESEADSEGFDPSEYSPDDVESWSGLGEIEANHGNSMNAKDVATMPDGSQMVHTDLTHHSISQEDGERQVAGYEAMKHLDPDRTLGHAYDFDAGWYANEVAPGVDAVDATDEMKQAVDFDDFVDMAAVQVIIGNADAHQNNIRVDEEGNLYPFDLDRAAGDIQGDWVGAFGHYENTLDRIFGELEKSASALDVQTGTAFRSETLNRAREIAEEYSSTTDIPQDVEEATGNTQFANAIWDNLQALESGEVSL